MKNQLAAFSSLLLLFVFAGLMILSKGLVLVATPLLLYLLGSTLLRPRKFELTVRRHLSMARVGVDREVIVEIVLHNAGDEIAELVIYDVVPAGLVVVEGSATDSVSIPHGETHSYSYTVLGGRGSYEFTRVQVSGAGYLALMDRPLVYRVPQELVILPDHRALSRIPIAPRRTLVYSGTLPSRQGGEGIEFYDVRRHSGTEALRRINWRLSARDQHSIYLNEFQQERVGDIAIVLDARVAAYPKPSHRSLFESSASAAASLTDAFLDSSNRVGLLTYGVAVDWTSPGFGKAQKHRILTRIAHVYPGESHVFQTMDAIPDRLFPAGSQIVVVSPLLPDDLTPLRRLRDKGYAVLVVSPDPVAFYLSMASSAGVELAENRDLLAASRFVRAERLVLLQQLRRSGMPVVDWDIDRPLEAAFAAAMGSIRAAWRRRQR